MMHRMTQLYCFINPEFEGNLLKYKSSLSNDLFVKDAFKRVVKWINYAKEDMTDIKGVRFSSYQIYSQVRCLIDSDLKLIKH